MLLLNKASNIKKDKKIVEIARGLQSVGVMEWKYTKPVIQNCCGMWYKCESVQEAQG